MKRALPLVLALLSMPAWATTYYVVGGPYTMVVDHTTCSTGTCTDYSAGGRLTGSFTTALPLAVNLPATEISALVTSYSFTDGVNTYSSAAANARVFKFAIQTDASGKPQSPDIRLQLWQTAGPHAAGDRFDEAVISGTSAAGTNVSCLVVGASPDSGVADTCTSYAPATTDTSVAASPIAPTWSVDVPIVVPPDVPTTYYVAAGPWTVRVPHSTCSAGTCADFPLATRVTGSFTTLLALPPNLSAVDVSALVSSWNFDDGIHAISSADANGRVFGFVVATDGAGVPSAQGIAIQRWQSAGPHGPGNDRFDLIYLVAGPTLASNNSTCTAVGPSPTTNVPDTCTSITGTTDTSAATSLLPTKVTIGSPPSLALTPTTYSYASGTYSSILNHTTCGAGICADYTTAMRLAGTITTVERIPPNMPATEFSGLISACSFSDGVHTIACGDAEARIISFTMQTDGAGAPTGVLLGLERWQGPAPHPAGSRIDAIQAVSPNATATFNASCPPGGQPTTGIGTLDACTGPATDTDSSVASAGGGTWTVMAAPAGGGTTAVPTLASWALAMLAACLAATALLAMRRRAILAR